VVRGAVGFHRALVMRDRLDNLAPDVRDDAEVLLDAREQLARLTAEVERLNEMVLRLFQSARTQRDPTHGVQRFGSEDIVAETARDLIAAVAELPGPLRIVAVVQYDREAPQAFGVPRGIAAALGGGVGGIVTRTCFRD